MVLRKTVIVNINTTSGNLNTVINNIQIGNVSFVPDMMIVRHIAAANTTANGIQAIIRSNITGQSQDLVSFNVAGTSFMSQEYAISHMVTQPVYGSYEFKLTRSNGQEFTSVETLVIALTLEFIKH